MAYVLKVKYENSLRRITLQRGDTSDNHQNVTFALLEGRIRDVFQFPSTAQLVVTYTDEEEDLVTMSSDQDVMDALILQALNPLRLHVTLVSPAKSPAPTPPSEVDQGSSSERNEVDATLNRVRVGLAAAPESVKQLLQPYERLFDGVTSPAQIPGVVENLIQTFATQLSSAVKIGAAAASAAGTAAVSAATTAAAPATPSAAPAPVQTEPFATSHCRSYADILRPAGKEARSARALGNDALFQAHQAIPLTRIPNFYPNVQRWNDSHLSKPAVHAGITCDVCGAFPIMGTRWKSTKRNDYDLCSVCFEREGDAADYVKMEKAASQFFDLDQRSSEQMPHSMAHHPMYAPQLYGGRPHGMRGPGPYGPFGPGGRHHCGGGPITGKLMDARFVCDVTMVDGTEVSSGLPFTKIWRLRNSGVYPWPAVTSLEHVGGDEMGQASRVLLLEIPHQGLAPGEEMNVAVDLVAPQKSGRYVSHWRLALPVGHRFGNRLSVRIQVMQTESIQEVESAAGSSSHATLASAIEEIASTQLPTVPITADVARVNETQVVETVASGSTVEVDSDTNSMDNALQQKILTRNFDLGEEFSIVYAADAVTSLADDAIRDYEEAKRAAEEAISASLESTTEAKIATEEALSASHEASREYIDATIAAQEAMLASLSARLSNTDEQAQFPDHVELAEKTDLESARESVRTPEQISYPTLDVVRDAGLATYPTIPNRTEPVFLLPKLEDSASSSSAIGDTATSPELYENAEFNPTTFDSMFFDNAEAVRAVQAAEEDNVPASKALLAKLDAMGFSDSKLNLELLERNNMDLRRTLDDLCTADEWEPFLAELEEMGFHDVAVNRRLMFKNNGSVKRVVKDLVQMYRDAQGKTVKVE